MHSPFSGLDRFFKILSVPTPRFPLTRNLPPHPELRKRGPGRAAPPIRHPAGVVVKCPDTGAHRHLTTPYEKRPEGGIGVVRAGSGLNCRAENGLKFLERSTEPYDAIFCEQELNHLTKDEMPEFPALR